MNTYIHTYIHTYYIHCVQKAELLLSKKATSIATTSKTTTLLGAIAFLYKLLCRWRKSRDSYARSKSWGSWIRPNHWMTLRKKHVGSHSPAFREIWYARKFQKSVQKIQVSLKCDKSNGYFTWRRLDIYGNLSLSLNSSENEKCFRQALKRYSKDTFYAQ